MSKEHGLCLVRAVQDGNFGTLMEVCTDEIVFTAATPGNTWKSKGKVDTENALKGLFPPEEKVFEVVSIDCYSLPGRSRIAYRIRGVKEGSGPYEYEHQAYYQVIDGKISNLRVLCSGLYEPEN